MVSRVGATVVLPFAQQAASTNAMRRVVHFIPASPKSPRKPPKSKDKRDRCQARPICMDNVGDSETEQNRRQRQSGTIPIGQQGGTDGPGLGRTSRALSPSAHTR